FGGAIDICPSDVTVASMVPTWRGSNARVATFITGALACVVDVPPNRLSAVVADAPASKRRRDSEMSITIRLPMHLFRGGRSSARDEPTPTGGRVHDPSKQK